LKHAVVATLHASKRTEPPHPFFVINIHSRKHRFDCHEP
jgi:hypothetical protein